MQWLQALEKDINLRIEFLLYKYMNDDDFTFGKLLQELKKYDVLWDPKVDPKYKNFIIRIQDEQYRNNGTVTPDSSLSSD